ncbi:ATP-dependent (S)-NAD(P)H-hydrate dehydratase [Gimesia alba]|uniref:ADP-dependent (S)-NAD(P)H-hydrate dehydratase n=1 Tax=Gimesia alba TaxID=2527973 RepID=A0A517RAU9_9PLAN|nr:NAD(P)H-hydrate dehydratase [Gimesia alba]QDT40923.1 ATP-dependent (S)-NAD(P)H-hydrate dehydratase [Gimesia alba]
MNIQRISDLPALPQRPENSHKGTFGKVLVIAGSSGMSGAACLAGTGALRSGAGLVFLAIPETIQSIVATVNPCYLTIPLTLDQDAQLTAESESQLLDQIPSFDAVAIGPGCGQQKWFRKLTLKLFAEVEQTLIVDADALNALARSDKPLPTAAGPRILTPHPGEFSRLINKPISKIEAQRETLAITFAKEQGVILVLKGAHTVITDGTRLAINPTGNSGMATGGSGDVLTGILTALVGQGMQAFEAAQLAAYIHGFAGDLAAAEMSEIAMIASDLPEFLPEAWLQLIEE